MAYNTGRCNQEIKNKKQDVRKKILFFVAEDSYFCSHRLNLAIATRQAGFNVAIATRTHHHTHQIQNAGIQVFPLKHFNRSSLNPWKQLCSFLEINKIYQDYKPDIVHHVAMKPIILGSLVAEWCKTQKVINALGGLGYLFTDQSKWTSAHSPLKKTTKSLLRWIVCRLLNFIFSRPKSMLILQNKDDIETLISLRCLSPKKVTLIRGSGVDTKAFPVAPMPASLPIIIACVSRMLWDKGIGELVEAATMLQEQKISAKIVLYGMPDPENPASIDIKQLQTWHDAGIINWQGYCKDTAKAYATCHIAVLPSYREGLPKSLLEAASCGRPIVTTDVPGCREVVENNKNGFLVKVGNAKALYDALIQLINNADLRLVMGENGRKMVELSFSDTIINKQIIKLYT